MIRDAARRSGLSIKAMSDRAAISYAGIYRFLNDESRTMTLRSASRLIEVLGLELKPVARPKRRQTKGR